MGGRSSVLCFIFCPGHDHGMSRSWYGELAVRCSGCLTKCGWRSFARAEPGVSKREREDAKIHCNLGVPLQGSGFVGLEPCPLGSPNRCGLIPGYDPSYCTISSVGTVSRRPALSEHDSMYRTLQLRIWTGETSTSDDSGRQRLRQTACGARMHVATWKYLPLEGSALLDQVESLYLQRLNG